MTSYLPPHDGLLPKWFLFISLVSVGNTIQAFTTTAYTARVYSACLSKPSTSPSTAPAPVTPLQARTFGVWTLLSSVIRLYAAYHIEDPLVYQLALWSYVIAFGHFTSEWLGYRTANMGAGLAGPVVVATGSLVWMLSQWGYYVR